MGRHSAPDGQEQAADTAHEHGTRGDLQLLREFPAVRARCAVVAVVPFACYTLALIVMGRTEIFLLWVWIPIVLAGVLVGAVLDLGYRSSRSHVRRR